jgi:hypothetical protein
VSAPEGFTPAAGNPLAELEFDWGDAYVICRDDEGGWQAARRDRIGALLTAPTSDELREAIRKDYMADPVARDLPPLDAS